jgi:hypothetical protein
MMLRLKLDNFVKREPDRSARNIPTQPLTMEQKKYLAEKCLTKCTKAYINRMRSSALLADFEEIEELQGEAYIAMWNILNKFDLSKCGLVQEFDEEGKTAPKTLEFYFTNYFYGRVNFIACEARAGKKQRGVGPAESLDDVSYDPEDEGGPITETQHKYEITGNVLMELKAKESRFQRFFVQMYRLQCTQRELREEYGDGFNVLKAQCADFISYIREKYQVNQNK